MRGMRAVLLAGLVAAAPLGAAAQSDDKSYLETLLQDNLSGAGRTVTVTGFAGALSSRATIQELTIADDQGVWLSLKGIELDWSRSALLTGRLSVNSLTAAEITVTRAPVAADDGLPAAEAQPFALPELPVSVEIGRIATDHLHLGEALIGEAVSAKIDGSLRLAGGEGRAVLNAVRTDDGPVTELALNTSFANSSRRLVVDLTATEEAGGLVGRLAKLPGNPDFELTLKGDGIVDAMALRLRLATAGEERLAGRLIVRRGNDQALTFDADLGGNVAPLFVPDYAEFFGPDIRLVALAVAQPDGRVELQTFDLKAQAIELTGTGAIAADGLPERLAVEGRVALASGAPVVLPIPGTDKTMVETADLTLAFDAAKGPDWTGRFVVQGLFRPDFGADEMRIDARGRIARDAAGGREVDGLLSFAGRGLRAADAALAQAIGAQLSGGLQAVWTEDAEALQIKGLSLGGSHFSLAGTGTVDDLSSGFRVVGDVQAKVTDASRFSALAGRPLAGSAELVAKGSGSALDGSFDVEADLRGQDLRVGQAQADAVLRGGSHLVISASRGPEGIHLRRLTAETPALTAEAQGKLASAGSSLTAQLNVPDLRVLGAGFTGSVQGKARLDGTTEAGNVTLDVTGRNLAVGQAQADRLLRGDSRVSLDLGLRDGRIDVRNARVDNPQIGLTARGALTGDVQRLTVDGRLADLELLVPGFPGAVTLDGTVEQSARGTALDLRARGPGGIDTTVGGSLTPDFRRGDLRIAGSAQAALANVFLDPRAVTGTVRYDLRLNGPLAPQSVTGTVTMADGRFSDPGLGLAIGGLDANVRLASGRATVDVDGRVAEGGRVRVDGTIGLAAPFDGNLDVVLDRVVLSDPNLYRTRANGDLSVRGPLTGGAAIAGRIALIETEVRVPDSFGAAAIPDGIRHVGASSAVMATLERAGLVADPAAQAAVSRRPYGLRLVVSAPNQVFVRGRGLDAELGGELRLGGTTDAILPSGGFDLIRGRLDILGKRLVLEKATMRLEGDFDPYLDVLASNSGSGVTSYVGIEGPASDPEVRFFSSPELPEEEVLAHLLFGKDLGSLSAFQAARLASAVATLAGKGGVGLMTRLRGGLGLDDLDVTTSESGGTSVTAGKYINDRTYTEVEMDDSGNSEVNLNFDLTDAITVRARTSTDGESGIGVFLEKDY